MLQRIQTIWLILALGCMAAFIVLPFGALEVPGTGIAELHCYDFIGLVVPAGLAALLQAVALFSYRHLPTQRSEAALALMMVTVAIGITVYILCDRATEGTFTWEWPTAFLAGSFVADILAIAGINSDIRLLRSYDRLR